MSFVDKFSSITLNSWLSVVSSSPISSVVYCYKGLIGQQCIDIAKTFGKYVDTNGIISINNDMRKWWNNFKYSNVPRSPWYSDQIRIARSRLELLHRFYNQIDPNYTPPWIIEGSLEYLHWNNL